MIVVLIIFSVGLLGLIIYYAVSAKSTRLLKFAATIALGLIGVAIIICAFFIIRGPQQDPDAVLLPFITEETNQTTRNTTSITDILIFIALFGVISLVIAKSMKEQKKMAKMQVDKKPAKTKVMQEDDSQQEEATSFLDDESFDLGGLD